jgi:hypothetical protein
VRGVPNYKNGDQDACNSDSYNYDQDYTNMSSTHANLIRLRGAIQQYDWGKTGSAALVAKLSPNALGADFQVQGDKPYAEV